MTEPGLMSPRDWEDVYARPPHWDLGHPQPAFRALAEAGAFQGRVLDVGCGTGEHVLLCAALGLDATGIDVAAAPMQAAEGKARDRGLNARFLQHDVRGLAEPEESFDTVLDCGLSTFSARRIERPMWTVCPTGGIHGWMVALTQEDGTC